MKTTLVPIWRFFIDVVVATTLFILIAVAAVGLNYLASSALLASTSTFMQVTFKYMSDAVFLVDTFLFAIYILRTTFNLARAMWSMGEEESK